MSGAGDWTPVLSAGELGAVAVHLVELCHVAALDTGELAIVDGTRAEDEAAASRSTATWSAPSGGPEGVVDERMGCLMKRACSPGCGAVAVDFSSDPLDWVWVGVALLVLVGMVAALVLRFRRRR
ncbi:hypothetical protein [Sorangium cellulosum]|uniref:hypothetical protein n=1 Tax=Sorangium cellulosum TaxID=56 RepID=UPI0013315478|nr:hypothetical protein [Sorangium cellulosum]